MTNKEMRHNLTVWSKLNIKLTNITYYIELYREMRSPPMDKIKEMEYKQRELIKIVFAIGDVLYNLKPIEYDLIKKRYLDHEIGERQPTMYVVASDLHTELRNLWRADRKIIQMMVKAYNEA